ncbi:MAG: PqqD family protein [Pseudomonadota bacterium]
MVVSISPYAPASLWGRYFSAHYLLWQSKRDDVLKMTNTVFKKADGVVASDLGEEWALLDLESSMYFTLNTVAVEVWKSLEEQPSDIDVLVDAVVQKFDVTSDQCRDDVNSLLADLTEAGLIVAVTDKTNA